ncbi:hypothetical protein [Arthrobacter sp. CAN_A1]|uniref:hypothetical protein n=1 Tax=Arthrobacter sp. CAN_A1 TaxID=2787717 RepID=UPI002FD03378
MSPAPNQEDGLRPGLDPSQVTPGLLGFIFTLVMVVAVIFLIRDMSKRIRRVRYQGVVDDAAAADATEGQLDDDGGYRPDGNRTPDDRAPERSDTGPGSPPTNR